MKEEIWKDIEEFEGYEGLYKVSNRGNVKSLNYRHTGKERILKTRKTSDGYLLVNLYKDGKMKTYYVHQLVATAFCENPEGYTEVNHKDENKENNCIDNLEWCSRSYNLSYNGRAKKAGEKVAEKLSKPVLAIHKISGLILEFSSTMEASRQTGINQGNITSCLKGRLKSAGGYYWHYADEDNNE